MTLDIHVTDPRRPEIAQAIVDQKAEALERISDAPDFTLSADELAAPEILVWEGRMDGDLAGLIALKALSPESGEVKAMRTMPGLRGRGIGKDMLAHLIAEARLRAYKTLWLETGSGPGYASARSVYERAGFQVTGPFGDYPDVETSVYMRLDL
ncbi:MAG: GNAT family N-acetyltransferase [Pseudomonadota bacterium]